jgi:hypothetical protein
MKAKGIKVVLGGLAMFAAFGAAVMLLWNLLIPEIFGLSAINFLQASGLLALARILFGSFGKGSMMMHGMTERHKNRIYEKWMEMTPEQRREFINKRSAFGFGGPFCRKNFETDDAHESKSKSDNER